MLSKYILNGFAMILAAALATACAPEPGETQAAATAQPPQEVAGLPARVSELASDIATPSQIVQTRHGRVRGLIERGTSVFKGLRYAAPPVGSLRFKEPEPLEAWQGLFDATGFGAPAVQHYNTPLGDTDLSLQLATVFPIRSETKLDSEDCLFLNVWTPAPDDSQRPVMVWLHGGGFAYGSGSWPMYDGANLARRGDVVVVTLNHRLNAFGYLYLAEIGGDDYAASGNAGMLDLVAALGWVRDNIAQFGGDPSNVTIMGESGGGGKVSTLMAMPAAKGLFHKAVVQSGPGLKAVDATAATASARAILDELSIGDDLGRLHQTPAEDLVAAVRRAAAKVANPWGLPLSPVLDGNHLPRHPFTPDGPAVSAQVPLLIGWNKDEMTLFNVSTPWFTTLTEEELMTRAEAMFGDRAQALVDAYARAHPDYAPGYVLSGLIGDQSMFTRSVTLAERKAAQGDAPAYMYYLTWETPTAGGIFKSPHTLEIPLMFDNVARTSVLTGNSPEAYALAGTMSDAWVAFARTGDPNTAGLPEWPVYDTARRATMVFDTESFVVDDPKAEIRALMPVASW